MRTGRSLTVCQSLFARGQGWQKKSPKKIQKNFFFLKSPQKSGGGVPGPGGGAVPGLGGIPGLGGLVWGGLFWGVWSGGSAPRGGVVSQHALRQTPPHEQNDKQV